jgi:serine/threonine protein kinase
MWWKYFKKPIVDESQQSYGIDKSTKVFKSVEGNIYDCSIVPKNNKTNIHFVQSPDINVGYICKQYYSKNKKEHELLEELSTNWEYSEDMDIPIIVLIGYDIYNSFIIINKCDTDLFDFLEKNTITTELFWKIVKELLIAIKYCHSLNIVHTDIKLENIGVCQQNNIVSIKLLDFGKSIKLQEKQYSSKSLRGSRNYTAPEVLSNSYIKQQNVKLIDYWELGVTCYALLNRHYPCRKQNRILHNSQIDTGCQKFINQLLEKNTTKRLNFDNRDITKTLLTFQNNSEN